jgi:hypothetical protein
MQGRKWSKLKEKNSKLKENTKVEIQSATLLPQIIDI